MFQIPPETLRFFMAMIRRWQNASTSSALPVIHQIDIYVMCSGVYTAAMKPRGAQARTDPYQGNTRPSSLSPCSQWHATVTKQLEVSSKNVCIGPEVYSLMQDDWMAEV